MPKNNELAESEDIVSISEFEAHAAKLLRRMRASGRPMVITQNGRRAAVVLAPSDFDAFAYREYVRSKVRAGIARARNKRYSITEVRERYRARAR